MTKVLLSIHPQWVEKIMKREKKWEIRKTVPKKPEPYRIFICQTGNGGVVGEFVCDYIEECEPENLSEEWLRDTEVSLEQAKEYAGDSVLYKYRIRSVIEYSEPRPIGRYGVERTPQSWCYVPDELTV